MKIAAFDIDGTLLFPHGIAAEDLDAIRAWQDAGHLAVAATGKSTAALAHALEPFDLAFDYSVVFSGAAALDRAGTYLFSRTMPRDTARHIVAPLIDDPSVAVYAGTLHERDALLSTHTAHLASGTILQDWVTMSLEELDNHDAACLPLLVPDDRARQMELREQILRDHPEVAVQVNRNFLDVVPADADKATGLEQLIAHLGLAREDVTLYTFGDSWNDLGMHAIADRSYAFPWSPDNVMDAADEVIESVAPVLRRLLR